MRRIIERVPLPMAGVMLAFAALGNFMKKTEIFGWFIPELISVMLLVLLLLKIVLFPRMVRDGMRGGAVAGASGALSMGLMYLGACAGGFSHAAGSVIWYIGFLVHILLIVYFTARFVFHFQMKQVYITWFLVYVGIAAASQAAASFGLAAAGQWIVWYGLAATPVLMVLITIRYRRIPSERPLRPLLTIYAAPVSLCLAGYLAAFPDKSRMLVLVLIIIAQVFYVYGLVQAFRMIAGPFSPAFSGFTFPLVSTAAVTYSSAVFLGTESPAGRVLLEAGVAENLIGAAFLLFVFVRYLIFLGGSSKKMQN